MVGFKDSEIDSLAEQAEAVFGAAALDAPDLLRGLGAKSLREMRGGARRAEDERRRAGRRARRRGVRMIATGKNRDTSDCRRAPAH